MTNTNLLQAMGGIDPKLIADAAPDAEPRKSANKTWVKWASMAACFCLLALIGVFTIPNLIGYQSGPSEDELWERTNTYFDSYEDLVAVIGNDTLLENINFASLNDYELRLVHELDNVNVYHTVSFVNIMPEDEFGFGIQFPPYNKQTANYIVDCETVIINGVTVRYEKRGIEGSNYKYNIAAEFEYIRRLWPSTSNRKCRTCGKRARRKSIIG